MGAVLGNMMLQMQNQMIPYNQPMPAAVAAPPPAAVPAQHVAVAAATAPTLVTALKELENKTPNERTGYLALTTLNKILENIELYPMEAKYRRVTKSNARFAQTLGQFTTAPLVALGFTDNGEDLVLVPSEDKWPKLLLGRKLVQLNRKRRLVAWLRSVGAPSRDALFAQCGLDKTDAFVADAVADVFPAV